MEVLKEGSLQIVYIKTNLSKPKCASKKALLIFYICMNLSYPKTLNWCWKAHLKGIWQVAATRSKEEKILKTNYNKTLRVMSLSVLELMRSEHLKIVVAFSYTR